MTNVDNEKLLLHECQKKMKFIIIVLLILLFFAIPIAGYGVYLYVNKVASSVQVTAGNKFHESIRPYRIAFAKKYGADFLQNNFAGEGVASCEFNKDVNGCEFIKLKNVDENNGQRMLEYLQIARDPCPWIDEQGLELAFPFLFDEAYKDKKDAYKKRHIRSMQECKKFFARKTSRISFIGNGSVLIELQ